MSRRTSRLPSRGCMGSTTEVRATCRLWSPYQDVCCSGIDGPGIPPWPRIFGKTGSLSRANARQHPDGRSRGTSHLVTANPAYKSGPCGHGRLDWGDSMAARIATLRSACISIQYWSHLCWGLRASGCMTLVALLFVGSQPCTLSLVHFSAFVLDLTTLNGDDA